MPEKTAEKVEETARQYMREAENVAQNAFRTGNDFFSTTMKYYFDAFDSMMKYNTEFTNTTQHAMDDMMTMYRRVYTEGMKNWEEYLNDINKIFARPTK